MQTKKHGYPADHLRRSRQDWIGYAKVVLVAGIIACFFAYRAIYLDSTNGDIVFAGIGGAVFLFLLWIGYGMAVSRVRIALYFEKKVPGNTVWSEVLARNCNYLDAAAVDAGQEPLSAFGFADDFRNETVIWHNPQQGLATVSELIKALQDNPQLINDADCALSDLIEIRARLQEVGKHKTGFCLIFHYDGINSMEIEQRKGYF